MEVSDSRRYGPGWHHDAYAGDPNAGAMPFGLGMPPGNSGMPMGQGLELLNHPFLGSAGMANSGLPSLSPPALPGQRTHPSRQYGDAMLSFGGAPMARSGRQAHSQQRGGGGGSGSMGRRAPPPGRYPGAQPGGSGAGCSPQLPGPAGGMPGASLSGGMAAYGLPMGQYGGEYGGGGGDNGSMGATDPGVHMGGPRWLGNPGPPNGMELGCGDAGTAGPGCGPACVPGGMGAAASIGGHGMGGGMGGGMSGQGMAGGIAGGMAGMPGIAGGMPAGMPAGMSPPGMLPNSRAIFISHVAPGIGYEDVCSAVGAFGPLESVKILPDKRQAFVNFVDPTDALALMTASAGQIFLANEPTRIHWGKTRPVHPELLAAIGQGATRNLYVCNVPELATEAALISVFSLYGELESVRLIPTRHAVFANFTSVASAILARDELHGRPKPSTLLPVPVSPTAVTAGADSGALEGSVLDSGSHERPLHINFTTAQQNCMRARTGRTSWSYDERMGAGGGGGGGYAGRMGGSPPYGGRGGRFAPGPRPTGRSRGLAAAGFGYGDRYGDRYGGSYAGFAGRAAAGASAQPARSRGLYLGSLPISASLNELADLFEKYADIESMRLVRPKSCAFLNFFSEESAVAILARFGASEATLPTLHGHRITMNFAKARPCSDELAARYRQGARRRLRVVHARETSQQAILGAIGHRAEMVIKILEGEGEKEGAGEACGGGGEVAGDTAAEGNAATRAEEAGKGEAREGETGGGGTTRVAAVGGATGAGDSVGGGTVVTRLEFCSVGAACAAHDMLEKEMLEASAAGEGAPGEGDTGGGGEQRLRLLSIEFVVLALQQIPSEKRPPPPPSAPPSAPPSHPAPSEARAEGGVKAGVKAGGECSGEGAESGGGVAALATPAASDAAAREVEVAMEALRVEGQAEKMGGGQ